MSLNSNKKSLKESKVLVTSGDKLYIIKGNTGYKDNSSNQIVDVDKLASYINSSEGGGLWLYDSSTNTLYNATPITTEIIKIEAGDVNSGADSYGKININTTDITLDSNDIAGSGTQAAVYIEGDEPRVKFELNQNPILSLSFGGGVENVTITIPNYADDTAADADTALLSDSLYTTTAGGRTIFKKP